ncbi:hypothetical protein QAD02_013234 [Eretmocerus hayati]|uniref:Uncharacterized protein n=1 Tax=Eretmocerus hayati TaxID=131215 RepID=A0ACC2P245_9HYME|nr:hypothetical protein QAD02_013234 [Eretmocerus hayati]
MKEKLKLSTHTAPPEAPTQSESIQTIWQYLIYPCSCRITPFISDSGSSTSKKLKSTARINSSSSGIETDTSKLQPGSNCDDSSPDEKRFPVIRIDYETAKIFLFNKIDSRLDPMEKAIEDLKKDQKDIKKLLGELLRLMIKNEPFDWEEKDLIRLLQHVSRIPEFRLLWKDILMDPKSLHPNFIGVRQLLTMRTSRRFLQSRLTPDMEKKLVFLTSQVRFGNHKRYQEWFQRQYLATPESQTLRCDLIRFIVGVIHPSNELLCSDIIPRWAVIGWLFTTCTVPVAASNAKLALFYDWLFFESEKDNIMNIEPAILVMQNSMRSHPAVTATLLDFLCRIIPNFHPASEDRVRLGIFSSLKQILEKRVLPSLSPLFDNPKVDHELRTKIKATFKDFSFSLTADSGELRLTVI